MMAQGRKKLASWNNVKSILNNYNYQVYSLRKSEVPMNKIMMIKICINKHMQMQFCWIMCVRMMNYLKWSSTCNKLDSIITAVV